jgi:hypothetical protein
VSDTWNKKEAFLLAEYQSMQRYYEIQFNHFMAVFYLWSGVLGAGIAATVLSNLNLTNIQRSTAFGISCLSALVLGFLLSLKMFDLRKSQFSYILEINQLRDFFWRNYKIKQEDKLSSFSENANVVTISKTDFGVWMASIMSLAHGGLMFLGLYAMPFTSCKVIAGVVAGLAVTVANIIGYYLLVVYQLQLRTREKTAEELETPLAGPCSGEALAPGGVKG